MSAPTGDPVPKAVAVRIYPITDMPGKQFEVAWTDEAQEEWSVECDDLADVQQMVANLLHD